MAQIDGAAAKTQPVSAVATHGLNIQKALEQRTADLSSGRIRTQQYLETVLGLFWRFATSFSAQASLLRRLCYHDCQSIELCCRDTCSACTATVSVGATPVALANRAEMQRLRMTFPDPPPGITFRVIYGRSQLNVSTSGISPLASPSFLYVTPN
jgi:hypothetical protein